MTRIYDNSGLARRMSLSCVVVAIAALFGCWELWGASRAGDGAGTNLLFALFFIGGAIYAGKQILDGTSDSVVTLDADEATGEAAISLWRPFGARKIVGPLARLSDWQFQMKTGRTPILTAHHPDHPRPLEFELGRGIPISEGLRALAPEAAAAFERRSGA